MSYFLFFVLFVKGIAMVGTVGFLVLVASLGAIGISIEPVTIFSWTYGLSPRWSQRIGVAGLVGGLVGFLLLLIHLKLER